MQKRGTPDLAGAEAKLRRADLHLHALAEAFEGFRDLDPYTVGLEQLDTNVPIQPATLHVTLPATQGRFPTVRLLAKSCYSAVTLTPVMEVPALEWGAIIGDVVHNLASALDQLVWALGEANPDRPRPPAHGAPVHRDRWAKLERSAGFPYCRERSNWPDACRRRLLFVSPAHQAILEEAQPFNAGKHGWKGPEDHPLWVLHELWNRDKHRAINLTTVSGECTGLRVRLPGIPAGAPDLVTDMFQAWPCRPIQGQTEVARIRIHFPRPIEVPSKPEMQVDGKFALQIWFDELGSREDLNALEVLGEAKDVVADVIGRFA